MGEDVGREKIKKRYEETKPGHAEAKEHPTVWHVGAQEEYHSSQAQLPQGDQKRDTKDHEQPLPCPHLDQGCDLQCLLTAQDAIRDRAAWRQDWMIARTSAPPCTR
jgi:hypothetical protein